VQNKQNYRIIFVEIFHKKHLTKIRNYGIMEIRAVCGEPQPQTARQGKWAQVVSLRPKGKEDFQTFAV